MIWIFQPDSDHNNRILIRIKRWDPTQTPGSDRPLTSNGKKTLKKNYYLSSSAASPFTSPFPIVYICSVHYLLQYTLQQNKLVYYARKAMLNEIIYIYEEIKFDISNMFISYITFPILYICSVHYLLQYTLQQNKLVYYARKAMLNEIIYIYEEIKFDISNMFISYITFPILYICSAHYIYYNILLNKIYWCMPEKQYWKEHLRSTLWYLH